MKYKAILVCAAILLAGIIFISPAAKAAAAQEPKKIETPQQSDTVEAKTPALPGKDSSEYWVVRSQTVNELISFLTKKRSEVKVKLGYFKDYIEQIGKTDEMMASDIQGSNNPRLRAQALGILDELERKNIPIPQKPLSWDELVEAGMKFILSEGYLPVDIEGQEELDNFKKILERKEQFCIKVRKDSEGVIDLAIKSWLYLGTIDKQKDFNLYMLNRQQQEKQALEEQMQSLRKEKVAADKQRREQEKQNVWQRRQDHLSQHYGYYY